MRGTTSILLAAAAAALLAGPGPAAAQPTPLRNFFTEYAVKFVCGGAQAFESRPVFLDGLYATAVNVHNPGDPVTLERKVAVATLREGGSISGFVRLPLGRDQAIEFSCEDILAQARLDPRSFHTGFLVIHTPPRQELDVVAVYTAGPGRLAAFHTERVPARSVSAPFELPGGGNKHP
jgi:hypothetical protein